MRIKKQAKPPVSIITSLLQIQLCPQETKLHKKRASKERKEEKRLFLAARHGDALHKGPLREHVQDDQRDAADQHADGNQLLLPPVGHHHGLGGVRGEVPGHPGHHGGHLVGEDGPIWR